MSVQISHSDLIKFEIQRQRDGLAFVIRTGTVARHLVDARVSLLLQWHELAVIVGIVLIAALTVFFRHALAASWLIATWAPNHRIYAALLIGAITLAVGLVLAYWKKSQLFVYGLWEIAFGTYSAFQTALLFSPHPTPAQLLTIASGLYVVSRGAGNVIDAYKKEIHIQRIAVQATLGEAWQTEITSRTGSGYGVVSDSASHGGEPPERAYDYDRHG